MTDVLAPSEPYRSALAELPLSTRATDLPAGAIVVVPGFDGWVDAAFAAAEAGAAAVVVADPAFESSDRVRMLADRLHIPVVVERPLLRADLAEDAIRSRMGAEPRLLVADASAGAAQLGVVAREAVGWLRVLARGALLLRRADGALGLFETGSGVGAAVSAVATSRPTGGLIRAQALGETTSDIEVEGRRARLVTSSVTGRVVAPARFESSERLALRRALEALTAQTGPSDLVELAVDTESAELMLAATA
jgi:hypothetical protein